MITIKRNFTAYPEGKKREFTLGESVSDLGSDFETLLIKKGLASKSQKKVRANETE